MSYTATKTQKASVRKYSMLGTNAEKAMITAKGEIHLYGQMPNTNEIGWYFAGYAEEVYQIIGKHK